MIYKRMVPIGQVYTYPGTGKNNICPSFPSFIDTDEDNPLPERLRQVWLAENRFVLVAQSSISQLDRVSNRALVFRNDLDASIQWIAFMTKFQPKINITLRYESTTAVKSTLNTAAVNSTRSLWADFPALLRLIELAFEYDLRLTVNKRRAMHQAPVAGNYRGVDIKFVNHTNEHRLLLRLIRLSNYGKIKNWTMARLGRELAACLERHHWSTINPRLWKAVKRIRLPCDTEAFLGPHNLLYKTPHAALAAVQTVNMGEEPDIACFDTVWRLSLAVALVKWKQALEKQLQRYNLNLPIFNLRCYDGYMFDLPPWIQPLGLDRAL